MDDGRKLKWLHCSLRRPGTLPALKIASLEVSGLYLRPGNLPLISESHCHLSRAQVYSCHELVPILSRCYKGRAVSILIQRWHEKYGSALSLNMIDQPHLTAHDQRPIIRIYPTEIHISGSNFYEIIYSYTRVNKEESFRYCLGSPVLMHSTVEKDLHQKPRAAQTPYFSRRQVLESTLYTLKTCRQVMSPTEQ